MLLHSCVASPRVVTRDDPDATRKLNTTPTRIPTSPHQHPTNPRRPIMPPKRSISTAGAANPLLKRQRTSTPSGTPARQPLEKLPPLVEVSTRNVVPPVSVDPRAAPLAREILREIWGYPAFRLEQENAIARLISGGSAVVVFPTGGGKSLVYQIPALAFDQFDEICGKEPGCGLTLVVSPLIALMKVFHPRLLMQRRAHLVDRTKPRLSKRGASRLRRLTAVRAKRTLWRRIA